MLRFLSAAALVVVLLAVGPTPVPGFAAVTTTQTRMTVQAFYDAYNRHDLQGTLAMLGTHFTYADCDYVWDTPAFIYNKAAMSAWLRARFAEHDHFDVADIVGGGVDGSGDALPNVAGVDATRTNDVLRAQGITPRPAGAKVILDGSGRVEGLADFTFGDCTQLAPRPGPDRARTRGMVWSFLDAYNARDLTRVLQLVSPKVSYRDDAIRGEVAQTISGVRPLRSWLRARFNSNDTLSVISISVGSGRQARVAEVRALRSMEGSGGGATSDQGVVIRFTLGNSRADHITGVLVRPSAAPPAGAIRRVPTYPRGQHLARG